MKKALKSIMIAALSAAVIGGGGAVLTGCVQPGEIKTIKAVTQLSNGGFETGDLSGWTVERGDAFDDYSVSSTSQFSFSYDADHKMIPVDQTGTWYLSGKGYDGKRPHGYTGSIRSENFTLGGDGTVSMKLAGGAAVTRRGDGAPLKSPEKTCYVGVYRASDDMILAKFTNKYFLEHTEEYVNVSDYTSGTCCTDNFYRYTEDLSEYIGEEMYIRIVDNDTDVYYGYISVDDIRLGGGDAQIDGALFAKTKNFTATATAPSKYEIANGGFETGSLAGWTVVSGNAFSNDGVTDIKYWWNESIPYDRDGEYHYGHYEPSATGVMRSTEFEVGGSGYISYKLGGCSNNLLTYLRFMVKSDVGDVEVARFSNFKYWNYQFPYIQNGMRLLNMVQYYADFSAYIGKTMYIEVVDENGSSDELGCITLDSVCTYYENVPHWYNSLAFEAKPDPDLTDIETASKYQVKNGTFETGDLTGWEMTGDIGEVTGASGWWNENLPYNKKGSYLFTGITKEGGTGTLTSSAFELGGTGYITFRLGGGGDPSKCYLSVIDAESEEELARFANLRFKDNGIDGGVINTTSYLANMVKYRVDLTECGIPLGSSLKLRIVDNATSNWGLVTADSFITYYETLSALPDGYEPRNVKPAHIEYSEYQVLNGSFETGDLTGWTVVSGEVNENAVSNADTFWNEEIPYNKCGLYHFDGWKAAANESATYAIRSTKFILTGSGYISFRMAGRTAAVKVYKSGEDEPIAVYRNTAFKEDNFPYVEKGNRLATMTTFIADLSSHIGESLIIELCDESTPLGEDGNELSWGVVFFDDIITHYEQKPVVSGGHDTVILNPTASAAGATKFNIPWVEAVNALPAEEK